MFKYVLSFYRAENIVLLRKWFEIDENYLFVEVFMEIQKFKEWLIRTILKVVDYEEIVNEQEFFLKIKDNYKSFPR